MKKREMIKGVLGFGASVGAGMIVGNLVRVITPGDATKLSRLFIRVGTYALAGVAMDKAEENMSKQVDQVAEAYDAIVGAVKSVKEGGLVHNITNVDDKKE